MRSDYDIIIVGASVAGAASAIALAPHGYRILLLDRAAFPRDKACGEGIMPQGVRALAEIGLLEDVLAHGATVIRGLCYRNRDGVSARADFPPNGDENEFGIVIRRWHLDHLLVQRASSFPNITVREGFKVTKVIQEGHVVKGVAGCSVDSATQREEFQAPLTIGADGRHSVFHLACRLTKTFLPRRRFGVTGHLTGVEGCGEYIETVLHPGGEIYIAPCGDGLTLVALLLEESAMRFFKGTLSSRYHAFLRSAAGFSDRTVNSEPVGPVFLVGPLGFSVEPCHRPGLLLIGDSAGFLDPITAEGMTLAMKTAQAVAPLIKRAFAVGDFGEALGRRYVEERLKVMGDVVQFTQLLLNLVRYKFVADRAIRRLSHDEPLFQKLLGIAAGSRQYRDLSMGEKTSLLIG